MKRLPLKTLWISCVLRSSIISRAARIFLICKMKQRAKYILANDWMTTAPSSLLLQYRSHSMRSLLSTFLAKMTRHLLWILVAF